MRDKQKWKIKKVFIGDRQFWGVWLGQVWYGGFARFQDAVGLINWGIKY